MDHPETLPPHIGAFALEHNRLPTLELDRTPWLVGGWMLHYIQLAHLIDPEVPNRWGYALSIVETGELPYHPIPRITFGHPSQGAGGAVLERALGLIARSHGTWPAMRLLLEWLGFGLMVHPTPPQLDEALARRLYVEFDFCELLLEPADYIGWLISQRKGRGRGWNPTAFFPTPHAAVECMVEMAMHDGSKDGKELRLMSVLDPCVGTGRMLLHASNHSLILHGCDIDPLVLLGARINGALYAPWMAFPLGPYLTGESRLGPPPSVLEAAVNENPDAQAHLERITDALGRGPRGADGGPARPLALHDRQLSLFEL